MNRNREIEIIKRYLIDYAYEDVLLYYDFNYLIFNRLDVIHEEAESMATLGRTPYCPIEKEVLDFLLTFHWDNLTREKRELLNNIFTLLHYVGYIQNPLRPRHRKEVLLKRRVNANEIRRQFLLPRDDLFQHRRREAGPNDLLQLWWEEPRPNDLFQQGQMNLEPNNDLIGPNEEWPYLNLLVDDYLNIEDEILEFDFQFM